MKGKRRAENLPFEFIIHPSAFIRVFLSVSIRVRLWFNDFL
jgi:hypothetical protein